MWSFKKLYPEPTKPLDFLFLIPSLNYKLDLNNKLIKRIEGEIANQESPNVGIAYMMAVAKQLGYHTTFMDMAEDRVSVEELLDYIEEYKPLIVGFAAYTVQVKSAAAIARAIQDRFPQIKIAIGGPHAAAMPVEVLEEFEEFDFSVPGEAETILPDIIECVRQGGSLADVKGIVTRGNPYVPASAIADLDRVNSPSAGPRGWGMGRRAGRKIRITSNVVIIPSRLWFPSAFVRDLGSDGNGNMPRRRIPNSNGSFFRFIAGGGHESIY